jgi:hypothetical protein
MQTQKLNKKEQCTQGPKDSLFGTTPQHEKEIWRNQFRRHPRADTTICLSQCHRPCLATLSNSLVGIHLKQQHEKFKKKNINKNNLVSFDGIP